MFSNSSNSLSLKLQSNEIKFKNMHMSKRIEVDAIPEEVEVPVNSILRNSYQEQSVI